MKLEDVARHPNLYPERHLNVFVPFASHDLDHNVTRAVISTLRWSRPELTQAFLTQVVGLEGQTAEDYCYDLGACDYTDFDPADCSRRVVLGISGSGQIAPHLPSLDDINQDVVQAALGRPVDLGTKLQDVRRLLAQPELDYEELATLAHTLDELADGSLPDGWIFSAAAGTCVLIEAKLLHYLDAYQLERYAEVYYGGRETPVLCTWDQIASFFATWRNDSDPRTGFLTGQLCDYLDLLGLNRFHGFRPYDFDPDASQEARTKFLRFAEALHAAAREAGLPLAELAASPIGARLGFADAGTPGEVAVDLLATGVRIEYRVGDAVQGRFPGRQGVDEVLRLAQEREGALLESAPAGLSVRVERLRSETPDGVASVERETFRDELSPESLTFALEELQLQHPSLDGGRDVSGGYRHGALSVGLVIPRREAVGDGDGAAVLARATRVVGEVLSVARALTAAATVG
ncbi:MAG: hypothetical protein KDD82_06355 [Planctomycetes bacterium]|nr:hypothetical protein [Planctomycetota bacterium]